MKKKIIFMFACLACMQTFAQEKNNIGYCDGQIATTSNISFGEDNAWGHAAICLTAEELQPYSGCQITSINAGLTSRINLDSLCVWIRSSLDSENLCEGIVTSSSQPKILRGWNSIELDKPYTIADGETLYVGYSYKQTSPVATISCVLPAVQNSFFAKFGSEETWKDMSSEGALSVEAVVSGNTLPQYDLKLKKAIVRWQSDGTLNIEAEVRNNALKQISGFSLKTSIEGSDEMFTNDFQDVIATGENATVTYSVHTTTEGIGTAHPVIIEISALGGGMEDENKANNSLTADFTYQRKVMLEEFSTESCPNCPKLADAMEQVLEMEKYQEQAFAVCHHSGYFTDWLTSEDDLSMLWFYNNNGATFAPAMMFDRHSYGLNESGNATPVILVSSKDDLISYIDDRLSTGSSAYINMETELAEDTLSAKVTVTGGRGKVFAQDSCITIYVTEDHIKAKAQSGATTQPYYHNHIVRVTNDT